MGLICLADHLCFLEKNGKNTSIVFSGTKSTEKAFYLKKCNLEPKLTLGWVPIPAVQNPKHEGFNFSRDIHFKEQANHILKQYMWH